MIEIVQVHVAKGFWADDIPVVTLAKLLIWLFGDFTENRQIKNPPIFSYVITCAHNDYLSCSTCASAMALTTVYTSYAMQMHARHTATLHHAHSHSIHKRIAKIKMFWGLIQCSPEFPVASHQALPLSQLLKGGEPGARLSFLLYSTLQLIMWAWSRLQ